MNTTPDSTSAAQPIVSYPADVFPQVAGARTTGPDNPPWGVIGALFTWFVSIALLAVVPNVCVLPYLAYRYRGVTTTRDLLLTDKTFVFLFVLGWVPAHLLTLALIWAITTRVGKRPIRDVLGWSWSPTFGFWKSAAVAISLFLITIVILGRFGGQRTDLDRILESSRPTAVALAVLAVATAPLVEEMIYRGLLYSAFRRAIGQWAAVVLVTSMFAGLHVIQYWPNAAAISSISLLSLVLTLIRARTGRLLPCYVVHLIFNGVQSVIIVLDPYLQSLFHIWRHEPVNGAVAYLITYYYR